VQNKSTIPLGRGGINQPHDGLTEKSREYRPHAISVRGNREATRRAVLSNNGPTSSTGVTLGGWTLP
jgi:hypothetical protein